MKNNIASVGFIVLMIGASAADSPNLIPSCVMIACGMILMMAGKKYA